MIDLATCLKVAVAFLGQMQITVEPLPSFVVLDRPGWFVSQPTIFLLPTADCGVVVHELVHWGQLLESGIAPDGPTWTRREIAAKRVEATFRSQDR